MRELFVYYRVDAANAEAAGRAVRSMQETLRQADPGLRTRLLARTDESSTSQTWMETYALPGSPSGIDARLEAAIDTAAAQWRHLVTGPRHVEAFTALRD